MVWDERLKREIPEGWHGKTIEDIEPSIITGKTPSTSHTEYFNGDIPFVTIDDIRGNLFVRESQRTLTLLGAKTQQKKFIPKGSLMCSCIGTVGVMGFAGRQVQTNQQINTIVFSKQENQGFILFALEKYFANADAKSGNILKNMSKQEFGAISISYPPVEILNKFSEIILPMLDRVDELCKEIELLVKLRDELLPLLMNGQVSVMPTAVNCDLMISNCFSHYLRMLLLQYLIISLISSREKPIKSSIQQTNSFLS